MEVKGEDYEKLIFPAVYQLSAQFPGPTSPREFITLLLTSANCLSDASKVGNIVPRHFMVVSIPVSHPDAPPRNGLIRGQYESVEMIREIPLSPSSKSASASTPDLLNHERMKSRERGGTIGFAESRGPEAKGEKIDRGDDDEDDPEANPVEWIMITRSDPGGGIPRFMVERSTPSSIVQDAQKFLDWACTKEDEEEPIVEDRGRKSVESDHRFSVFESNGILAGVGTSIADKPDLATFRRPSQRTTDKGDGQSGIIKSMADTLESYVPDSLNPLRRSESQSSVSTSSSIDSFASAEQYNTATEGLPRTDGSIPTPSTQSEQSLALGPSGSTHHHHTSRELEKIEQKRDQLKEKLDQARTKQSQETQSASTKSAKELEKATEKHNRDRKKQEDKFTKEIQKLEARRERETKKLLARQQKEADKNNLLKTQRERDEWKERAELAEQENKLLKEQIGELQRENTALVARMGKTDMGRELLKNVREEMMEGKGRKRSSSRASAGSGTSRASKASGKKSENVHEGSGLANVETGS